VARPKEALIHRDAVIVAALELIDGEGIDKFSMRVLAANLGVNAASLYHHFRDKDEILDGVARLALDAYRGDRLGTAGTWSEKIVTMVIGAFRSIQEHPNIVPLLIRRSDRHFAINVHERVARLLVTGGVPEHLIVPLLDALESLLIGTSVLEVNASSAVNYELSFVDFPVLHSAVAADRMDAAQRLELAVRALLRGWIPPDEQTAANGRARRGTTATAAKSTRSTARTRSK
jgi:TetR/AcrR family tetracycline transcriptional repressor